MFCSRPTAKVLDPQILNMFNTGSRLTGMESVVESVDSGLESAADSAKNLLRIGLWVRAFKSQNSQKLLRALTTPSMYIYIMQIYWGTLQTADVFQMVST